MAKVARPNCPKDAKPPKHGGKHRSFGTSDHLKPTLTQGKPMGRGGQRYHLTPILAVFTPFLAGLGTFEDRLAEFDRL